VRKYYGYLYLQQRGWLNWKWEGTVGGQSNEEGSERS
jgi:hypothetical protein